MITRTNKISNCYHPSHLPLLKAWGGEGQWWMGEPFIGPPLPLLSKGLASEMIVKKLTAGSQTSKGARAWGSMCGIRGGSSYVKHLP